MNEFVARFIGVMNVLETEVKATELPGRVAVAKSAHGQPDGARLRIGFSVLTQSRFQLT